MMTIRHKPQKETGESLKEHAKKVVDDWVADVLSDCRETPLASPPLPPRLPNGKLRRRKDGVPYHRSGTFTEGLFVKLASRGGVAAGLIGYIMAPATRLNVPNWQQIRDGFVKLVDALHAVRGVGWSRSRRGGS